MLRHKRHEGATVNKRQVTMADRVWIKLSAHGVYSFGEKRAKSDSGEWG